ncbi:MAG: hypothetical protein NC548_38220 [Lachnospiraceae bacterium]|nr:hypothetical protein [Lachnospiraceae bacterium]
MERSRIARLVKLYTHMENEYLKEIKDNLRNIGEDMACEILNAYYRECQRDDQGCIDNKGNSIYNLMDSRQAVAAVKHHGFANVCNAFNEKPDWILVVDVDMKSNPPKKIFSTEAPSVVLDKCLKNIICSYCYDPMAYPAFFREAVAVTLSKLCAIGL